MNPTRWDDIADQVTVALPSKNEDECSAAWVPHPSYKGVHLKHLLTGSDTSGRLSLHLVKVDPLCALAEHQHEKQWELHEVLHGKGTCRLENQVADYVPGTLAVIPLGSHHEVSADKEGLLLKAIFTPALL